MLRPAVALSVLLLMAAAAACGGGDSSPPSGPTPRPTATLSPDGVCRRDLSHVNFEVILPSVFPQDVRLVEACTHPNEEIAGVPAVRALDLIYRNPDETVEIQVVSAAIQVEPRGREQVDVAGIPGYIQSVQRDDGTRIWGIEFQKEGRAYTVIAIFGPNNQVAEDSIRAMAESVARGDPILP